jgi:hypothetical protein
VSLRHLILKRPLRAGNAVDQLAHLIESNVGVVYVFGPLHALGRHKLAADHGQKVEDLAVGLGFVMLVECGLLEVFPFFACFRIL